MLHSFCGDPAQFKARVKYFWGFVSNRDTGTLGRAPAKGVNRPSHRTLAT